MSREPLGRFAAYRNALSAVSARTGTPLPSLIVSFGILHEITAVVPLIAIFYGSRTLGVGENVVNMVLKPEETPSATTGHWLKGVFRNWVEEGDAWASRVGRRYGIFGYEKRTPGSPDIPQNPSQLSNRLAGDVANAIVAYGVTKALLPFRIGISLYLSPAFSRRVVEPIRQTVVRSFYRKN